MRAREGCREKGGRGWPSNLNDVHCHKPTTALHHNSVSLLLLDWILTGKKAMKTAITGTRNKL
jgi:hypothetical protein